MTKKILVSVLVILASVLTVYFVTVDVALVFPEVVPQWMYPVSCTFKADKDGSGETKGYMIECGRDFWLFRTADQRSEYIENGEYGVKGTKSSSNLWIHHWGDGSKYIGATMAKEGDNKWWGGTGLGAVVIESSANKPWLKDFTAHCYQGDKTWDVQDLPGGALGCTTVEPAAESEPFGVRITPISQDNQQRVDRTFGGAMIIGGPEGCQCFADGEFRPCQKNESGREYCGGMSFGY